MKSSTSGTAALTAVPVTLLLGLIGYHGYQVVAHEDDPQRGGAFAMFATIDIGATRTVVATTDGGAVQINVPGSLDKRRSALLDRPTASAAADLAASLLDLTWSLEGSTATTSPEGVRLDVVRVQVVGFDAEGRTISRQVLADVTTGSVS